jgi:hypothetical protein
MQEFWHDASMPRTRKLRRLSDAYRFAGFRPLATVKGIFGDPQARLVKLIRRGKKRSAVVAVQPRRGGTTAVIDGFVICPAAVIAFIWRWKFAGWTAGGVAP